MSLPTLFENVLFEGRPSLAGLAVYPHVAKCPIYAGLAHRGKEQSSCINTRPKRIKEPALIGHFQTKVGKTRIEKVRVPKQSYSHRLSLIDPSTTT